jgi:hypothetical protein
VSDIELTYALLDADLTEVGPSLLRSDLGRARGCLLGQLGGDSLGSLVEFEDASGEAPADIYRPTPAWAEGEGVDAAVYECLRSAEHSPPPDFQRQQGWVLITLRNAFWQLLRAPGLEEGVCDTVTHLLLAERLMRIGSGRPLVVGGL